MTIQTTCAHLEEVRRSLAAGQWPHATAPELRTHAETCTRCAQEILLTAYFQQARATAIEAAPHATPSLLWWRAQVQRRHAALTRAGRPLATAHAFALVTVVAALASLIGSNWQSMVDRVLSAQSSPADILIAMRADFGLAPLVLAFSVIAMLSGVVVYLTTQRQ